MKARPAGSALTLYGLIACMVLFWSGNYVAVKYAVVDLPATYVAALRVSLAGLLILPIYIAQQRKPASRDFWKWREAPMLFALGFLGVTLNQFGFVLGVSRTSVAHASIIVALTPILVLVIAACLGMERITRGSASGMLIALAGVAVLQLTRGATGTGRPTFVGDALVFLAALTFSLFTVFNKQIALLHTGATVNTFAYTGGALVLMPFTFSELHRVPFAQVTLQAGAAIFYMALFPSVIAYLIYSWALKRIPASQLAAFSYIQPLLATLMAALLLKEAISVSLVWAALLILAGVITTERARGVATEREVQLV